jgi:hypothetical protein
MDDHFAPVRAHAVLKQVDALPCAQNHAPAGYRNGKRGRRQRRPDMGSHVIRSFQRMDESRIVIRHQLLDKSFQIMPHIRIGILIDDQPAGRMAAEQCDQPGGHTDITDNRCNLVCDFVEFLPAC